MRAWHSDTKADTQLPAVMAPAKVELTADTAEDPVSTGVCVCGVVRGISGGVIVGEEVCGVVVDVEVNVSVLERKATRLSRPVASTHTFCPARVVTQLPADIGKGVRATVVGPQDLRSEVTARGGAEVRRKGGRSRL